MPAARIAAFLLASCFACGAAAGIPRPAMAGSNDIYVGGVWVLKITRDASGYTAEQRVLEVEKRITEVLSTPAFRTNGVVVTARKSGASAVVVAGDMNVITVTPQDAAGTGKTTLDLARQVALRFAVGLSHAMPDANVHVF